LARFPQLPIFGLVDDIKEFKKEIESYNVFSGGFQFEFTEKVDDDFLQWFISSGEIFEPFEGSTEIFEIIQSTASQCFHNSELFSLKNKDCVYYEGIMYGTVYKNVWHHGFNVKDGKAVDITYLLNPDDYEELNDKKFLYFGVKIPVDFIQRYPNLVGNKNVHLPLLYDYYKYIKNANP
jgi:hypothetical protein